MKRGVSLIAVLMFMLAATTASVVLFKWIGSENFASGARLKQSEAYQASEAGLDAVQSWLAFKGADAGAALDEYEDKNPQKLALELTKILAKPGYEEGKEGEIDGSRGFRVYLTGADISERPYKLEFMSIGTGRDGSEVSQTAVFNVDGLYRINVVQPPKDSDPTEGEFGEQLWGNTSDLNVLEVSNAVLTNTPEKVGAGGQLLNKITIGKPGDTSGYLVLDGDYYTNNGIKIYGDLYIADGKSFDLCASGNDFITGNSYIGGPFHARVSTGSLIFSGSVYFADTVTSNAAPKSGCSGSLGGTVTIGGNVSMMGPYEVYKGNGWLNFSMDSNLVMGPNSYIDLRNVTNATSRFEAKKNVALKNLNPASYPTYTYSASSNLWPVLGKESGSNLCLSELSLIKENQSSPFIYKDISSNVFYIKTHSTNSIGNCNQYLYSNRINEWGADPLDGSGKSKKNLKEKLKEAQTLSCEKTPIQFNKEICQGIGGCADEAPNQNSPAWVHKTGQWGSCSALDNTNSWATELQRCWNKIVDTVHTQNTELYDGWLVVYIKDRIYNTESPGILDSGKYIVVYDYEGATDKYLILPPTSPKADVMLYLPKGYPWVISLIKPSASAMPDYDGHRYFIFSDADINTLEMREGSKLKGNVFMNNCSMLNSGTGTNNSPSFRAEKNDSLVKELMQKVLCKSKTGKQGCQDIPGSSGGASSGSTENPLPQSNKDNYFIPVSSRLKVSLESKRISRNKDVKRIKNTTFNNVAPSILVMPRVVYLEPDEELTNDHYTFLYLNGAAKLQSPPSRTCYGPEESLTCSFGNPIISNFYVKRVGGSSGDNKSKTVSFDQSEQIITISDDDEPSAVYCRTVTVSVTGTSDNNEQCEVSFQISNDKKTSGWSIESLSGNPLQMSIPDNKSVYEICFIGDPSDNKTSDYVGVIMDVTGGACLLGSYTYTEVKLNRANKVYVIREERTDIAPHPDWLDCPAQSGSKWTTSGSNCEETGTDAWKCDPGTYVSLVPPIESVTGSCETVPTSMSNYPISSNAQDEQKIEASYKLKRYNLTVATEVTNLNITLTATNPHGGPDIVEQCNQREQCNDIKLYHGLDYTVTVTGGPSRMKLNNKWKSNPISITADGSLIIVPGETPLCEFNENPSYFCNADYVYAEDVSTDPASNSNISSGCFFVKDISRFCANQAGSKINGVAVTRTGCDGSAAQLPPKKDNGYYIFVNSGNGGSWSFTPGSPICTGGAYCQFSQTIFNTGDQVSAPSINGCSPSSQVFNISTSEDVSSWNNGGYVTFTEKGEKTVKLASVSCAQGQFTDMPCGTIRLKGANDIELTFGGGSYDFEPGEYNLTCFGNANTTLKCSAAGIGKTLLNSADGGCSSESWWGLGNFQACGNCIDGPITITGGTMRCRWSN